MQQAHAIKPGFQLNEGNASIIAEICVRLDGLLLALELAASRIKLLPPKTLLECLEHRLSVLTGGARNLPLRQQTLRNTIAWSYDLLSAGEQPLFRRLSVFGGGCTLEAVEAISAALSREPLDFVPHYQLTAFRGLSSEEEGVSITPSPSLLLTCLYEW